MLAIETVKILTAGKAMGNYSFENRVPMMKSATIRSVFVPIIVAVLGQLPALGFEPESSVPAQVKVAAVQMLGYDKTDLPRPGFDPSEAVVRYIEKASKDGAQLVVFPEYLLGRISVPGPQTERISKAAAAGKIYVVVGCWEVYERRILRQHGPPVRPGGQDRRQVQQGPCGGGPVRGRAALVETADRARTPTGSSGTTPSG